MSLVSVNEEEERRRAERLVGAWSNETEMCESCAFRQEIAVLTAKLTRFKKEEKKKIQSLTQELNEHS